MPELPEVETIRQELFHLKNQTIENVSSSIHLPNFTNEKKNFSKKLIGLKLKKISRQGKWLLFEFTDDSTLFSHLGMSGQWHLTSQKTTQKHIHLSLYYNNNISLHYIDPRRFGHFALLDKKRTIAKISQIGVDVLSLEFTTQTLTTALENHPNLPIKALLLNQKYFAGVGNYIANEICARSHLLPTTLAKDVNPKLIPTLFQSTKKVIELAIASKGVTFGGAYKRSNGESGEGKTTLLVFHQKICQMCLKTEIIKITLLGRGTFYCPHCQK